jgi:hypothetical protein
MEISPIPGIRAVPGVKAPPLDARLTAIFDVENFSGPGDDTYSGSGRKAAGGQDDEDEDGAELESPSDSLATGGTIHFLA